jgi:hypothetical protein
MMYKQEGDARQSSRYITAVWSYLRLLNIEPPVPEKSGSIAEISNNLVYLLDMVPKPT